MDLNESLAVTLVKGRYIRQRVVISVSDDLFGKAEGVNWQQGFVFGACEKNLRPVGDQGILPRQVGVGKKIITAGVILRSVFYAEKACLLIFSYFPGEMPG